MNSETLIIGDTWSDFGPFGVTWSLVQDGAPYQWPNGTTAVLLVYTAQGEDLLELSTATNPPQLVIDGSTISPDVLAGTTAELAAGTHYYDLRVTLPDGDVITVVHERRITIRLSPFA